MRREDYDELSEFFGAPGDEDYPGAAEARFDLIDAIHTAILDELDDWNISKQDKLLATMEALSLNLGLTHAEAALHGVPLGVREKALRLFLMQGRNFVVSQHRCRAGDECVGRQHLLAEIQNIQ